MAGAGRAAGQHAAARILLPLASRAGRPPGRWQSRSLPTRDCFACPSLLVPK